MNGRKISDRSRELLVSWLIINIKNKVDDRQLNRKALASTNKGPTRSIEHKKMTVLKPAYNVDEEEHWIRENRLTVIDNHRQHDACVVCVASLLDKSTPHGSTGTS